MMVRLLIVCALAGMLAAVLSCTPEDNTALPSTQVGELVSWTKYLDGVGVVQANEEHFLSVNNGGKLENIAVTAGSPVKLGQIIAVVDETTRKAELEQALSNYKLAASEFARVKRMRRVAAATEQEYDRARNEMLVRKSALRKAKQDMEDSLLRSPVDGLLSFFAFRAGDYVPAGSRMAIVEDRTAFKVITKIPFRQIQELSGSTTAQIYRYDTMNRRSKGDGLDITVDISQVNITSDFDAANRDVLIRFADTAAGGVEVGAAVMIKVAIASFPETALIGEEFVVNGGGETAVVTRDGNGVLRYMQITLRGREADKVAVAGLLPGTTLVRPNNNNNGGWHKIVTAARENTDRKGM